MFEWNTTYKLHSADIDAQHEQAFALAMELRATLGSGQENGVSDILGRMVGHFRDHFESEEKLMMRIGFPGLVEHKKLHRAMMTRLEKLASDSRTGLASDSREMMEFLRDWLSHQTGTDMAMLPFITGSRMSTALAQWIEVLNRAEDELSTANAVPLNNLLT